MPNIHLLSEAEARSIYYASQEIWWTSALAKGTHQELCWAKFEPGAIYPIHSHAYEQTSIIVAGRMRLTVGDETREVGPGDMWFVPAHVRHGGHVPSGGRLDGAARLAEVGDRGSRGFGHRNSRGGTDTRCRGI